MVSRRSIFSVAMGVIAFALVALGLAVGLTLGLDAAGLMPGASAWLPYPIAVGAGLSAGAVAAALARENHRRVGAAAGGLGMAATLLLTGDASPIETFEHGVIVIAGLLLFVGIGAAGGALAGLLVSPKPRDHQ